MNSKDPVPRHPLAGGHHGVGTHYFIDKKGGGGTADWAEYMVGAVSMVTGVLGATAQHLTPEYLISFQNAAKDFNGLNHA